MSPAMDKFIKSFLQTKDDHELRKSFMQWMKFYLDSISHKELPDLQKSYHNLWNTIQNQKHKKLDESIIKKTQEKLNEVEINLIASSFGLEHFMREVGQVYEAIIVQEIHSSGKIPYFESLPRFAADLLISGFPLEIMDGDASHMPLTWVKAVFDSLKRALGDKKVYVVSVLGVQSSGKSTLLNTMFGLNFAVSAGRCTKGVFAQLIPVEYDSNLELGYDYILVLDTEGLRAPEHGRSKLTHDNELATLVIGMGDVTVLNIKGENTAEIEDVLQICVHAFLRMKLANKSLKLQPGCYFVHQNVSALDAHEKMQCGYKILQEELDRMSILAAELEQAYSVQSFRDVIEFDVNNNIWYLSSLWKGDPPMAPSNPSYSEKVLELKTSLLKHPSKNKISCLTLSNLKLRMSDLWNAILYENFLFDFRNSLEVKSYSNLENKYSSISWDFRNTIKKWEEGSLNQILSCEEKNFNHLNNEIISCCSETVDKAFLKYKEELDNFFSSAEDKEVLKKWRSETEIKLRNLTEEIRREAKQICESNFEIRRAQFVQENKVDSYQNKLLVCVNELISKNTKKKLSDKDLDKMFAEQWNKWMKNLGFEKVGKKDIEADVLQIFSLNFKKNKKMLSNEVKKQQSAESDLYDLDSFPDIDTDDYKSSIIEKGKTITKNPREYITEIQILTREILKAIKTFLDDKKDEDYDKNFIFEILDQVKERIEKFNSNHNYELKINYSIKMNVHIMLNLIPIFEKRHKQFTVKNDPQHYLEENFKPQLEKFFKDTVSQCKKEQTAADLLSSSIKKAIISSLKRDLPRIIAENIRSSSDVFHTKINLYIMVMEDLGNLEEFEMYIEFIKDPNLYMKKWLKIHVKDYCATIKNSEYCNFIKDANGILKNKIKDLQKCAKDVTDFVSTDGITFKKWLQKFQSLSSRIIPLHNNLFNLIDLQKVQDLAYFEERIIQSLDSIQNDLENTIITWNVAELHNMEEEPHEILAKNLLGCTERCPFCYEVCIHTIPNHDTKHSTPQHRPQVIGGYKHITTNKMLLSSCNVVVMSDDTFNCRNKKCKCYRNDKDMHAYKEYYKAGPYYTDWRISPDTSLEGSAYWKWVCCKFSKRFESHYDASCSEIPPNWHEITWEEAKKSLRETY